MADIKPGDPVRLFNVNSPAQRGPNRGTDEGAPGTVVKVGRVLVTIKNQYGQEQKFRLDTGRSNDAYGHDWFKTPEQMALDVRYAAAVEVLRGHRISLDFGASLTLEQIEALAEVIKTWQED